MQLSICDIQFRKQHLVCRKVPKKKVHNVVKVKKRFLKQLEQSHNFENIFKHNDPWCGLQFIYLKIFMSHIGSYFGIRENTKKKHTPTPSRYAEESVKLAVKSTSRSRRVLVKILFKFQVFMRIRKYALQQPWVVKFKKSYVKIYFGLWGPQLIWSSK